MNILKGSLNSLPFGKKRLPDHHCKKSKSHLYLDLISLRLHIFRTSLVEATLLRILRYSIPINQAGPEMRVLVLLEFQFVSLSPLIKSLLCVSFCHLQPFRKCAGLLDFNCNRIYNRPVASPKFFFLWQVQNSLSIYSKVETM